MQSFENRGSKFQSPNIQMGALTLRVSQSRSVKGRSGAEGNTLITGTEAKLCGQGLQAVHDTRNGAQVGGLEESAWGEERGLDE